jgi:AraC-like DNA-binding protein
MALGNIQRWGERFMALHQPLARYALFATTDVDEAREEVARVFCDHRLKPRERTPQLGAWQNIARLGSMAVGAMGYGADVEIDPGTLGDFYLLMLPYAGGASIQHGGQKTTVTPACGSILNPDDPTLMQWSAECAQVMVRIDRLALERQLSVMLGGAPVPSIRFDLAMPTAGSAARWWHMVTLLMDGLDAPSAMPNSLATSLHESLLLVSLLDCQAHSHSNRLGKNPKSIAPRHVRQVEAYIEEHADQPLTVGDLIAVSGVSARALFDGFRRFRDTSPLAYLRGVRLARARQQLLNPGQDETVSAVAMQWGFYQLGRFAALYKATYGEAPSETLRRL